jgi:tetratricopeptide (TPR) repeat protein/serine phosphatase RsbU (regulator of sigma subunit)
LSQNKNLSVLLADLKQAAKKTDTSYYSALNQLGDYYQRVNPDSAIYFHKRSVEVAKKLNDALREADALKSLGYDYFVAEKKDVAIQTVMDAISIAEKQIESAPADQIALKIKCKGLGVIGSIYYYSGELAKATEYYSRAVKAAEEWGDKRHEGGWLSNLGLVYSEQSNYPKALDCYLRALKINEDLKDKFSMGKTLDNIGILYLNQGEYDKALSYHERSLQCGIEADNKPGISAALVNIGIVYGSKKMMDKALEYYEKALKIDEELGEPRYIAQDLNNIAIIYQANKDYKKARETLIKVLEIKRGFGDKLDLAVTLGSLGELYTAAPTLSPPAGEKLKGYALAQKYLDEAIAAARELNMLNKLQGFELHYSSLDTLRNNWRGAFYHYRNAMDIKDSVFKEQNIKNQARLESKYEYDKRESLLKEQQAKERGIAEERNRRQKWIISSASVVLLLVLGFAVFAYRSLRTTRKQKLIIERSKDEVQEQKKILEEKNKEILDSITYSKRIQDAILPGEKTWKSLLPKSFVLYHPKDIVAGDFYWLEQMDGKLFIAAADCTGHGVPGAMVSVVCSNALTRAVMEEKISETNNILDRAREIVLEKLTKNEENIRDGMDICLVRLDAARSNVQYSGANRPLYIVREGQLLEYKADKQPVGNYEGAKSFNFMDIPVQAGDRLYLFTDGYADQFGGDRNKKMGNKTFRQLINDAQALSISQQREFFEKNFLGWKEKNEQVDDVSIIGIEI